MEFTYVVVGGGIAGMSCVEAVSILDENASILLVSLSPFIKAITNITPITRTLAEYSVEEKSYEYISSLYSSLKIVIDTVTHINSEDHIIKTLNNGVIKYEKLCLCTGASPKIAKTNKYVIGIRDTDSVQEFENKLKNSKRIAVVGNGGIATELVYEIQGVDIIWIIKDKHISAAFVDPGAAEFFQDRLDKSKEKSSHVIKRIKYTVSEAQQKSYDLGAALGPNWHDKIELINKNRHSSKITVEYKTELNSFMYTDDLPMSFVKDENEWPVYIKLSNGKIYGCDFVVSATGVTPNSETISIENGNFELAADKGIKVNWKMETNVKDIYAAGDVCSVAWELAPHWFQMRLWTQARQMGSYVAKCMVDAVNNENTVQDFCFELFTHVTRFFGYKVILLGLFNAQKLLNDYELMLRVTKGAEYVKLVIKNGRLQGAVLIGETDLEEMCENLILNQLDISEYGEDLLNPNIDIEDYFD